MYIILEKVKVQKYDLLLGEDKCSEDKTQLMEKVMFICSIFSSMTNFFYCPTSVKCYCIELLSIVFRITIIILLCHHNVRFFTIWKILNYEEKEKRNKFYYCFHTCFFKSSNFFLALRSLIKYFKYIFVMHNS